MVDKDPKYDFFLGGGKGWGVGGGGVYKLTKNPNLKKKNNFFFIFGR